jgi:hypothetical protein
VVGSMYVLYKNTSENAHQTQEVNREREIDTDNRSQERIG